MFEKIYLEIIKPLKKHEHVQINGHAVRFHHLPP